jgi:hypothetical protein
MSAAEVEQLRMEHDITMRGDLRCHNAACTKAENSDPTAKKGVHLIKFFSTLTFIIDLTVFNLAKLVQLSHTHQRSRHR